jgi:DNA polymerase-1
MPESLVSTVVVIDFSNLCYQAWFASGNNPGDEIPEDITPILDVVMHRIKLNLTFLSKYKLDVQVIFFAEDRECSRKKGIYTPYKSNRTGQIELRDQIRDHIISKGVEGYQAGFVSAEGEEADDVMATLACNKLNLTEKIIIVTTDRDLWQLVGNGVNIFHPLKHKFITMDDIKAAFRVGPEHIALVKSLWGDGCDMVPNAMPRTQKDFIPLIQQSDGTFESLEKIVKNNWLSLSPRARQIWEGYRHQAEINYQLVTLRRDCPLSLFIYDPNHESLLQPIVSLT